MEVVAERFSISCPALPVFKTDFTKQTLLFDHNNNWSNSHISSNLVQQILFAFFCAQNVALTVNRPRKVLTAKSQQGQQLLQQGGWGWTLYTDGQGASGLRHRASWPGSEAQLNPKLWFLGHNKAGNTFIVFNVWDFIKFGGGRKKSTWMVKIRTRQTVPGCNKIAAERDELGFGRPPAQLESCSDWHPWKS